MKDNELIDNPVQKPQISIGRILYPIKGYRNCGGKGYKRSYIFQHFKIHVAELLADPTQREERNKTLQMFSNHICCKKCCYVVAQANTQQLCIACGHYSLPVGALTDCKDEVSKVRLQQRIRCANKTHLRILSDIPRSLQRLWSSCVTSTLMRFATAKSELESLFALECWVKLKSSLVIPLKAGKQRKKQLLVSTRNK